MFAGKGFSDNKGVVELATDAETLTGSATDRATTPSNLTGMGLLPLGTAGQVLRVNSGASALEYGTVSSTVPIGHLSGLVVSRKDDDEIYVSAGSVEVDGTLLTLDERVAVHYGSGGDWSEDIFTGGTAIGQYGANYADCFDDNEGTYGQTTPQEGAYIGYALAAPACLQKIRLRATGANLYNPKTFTVRGSDNGSTWTTLLTVTDFVWNTTSDWKEWEVTNETAYSYYAIFVAAVQQPTYVCRLMEIQGQFLEYALEASTTYFVYVDPPSEGAELAAENIVISSAAPAWDGDRGGFYHPTNTDQRAIAHFTTDASGHVPTAPFVHYQPLPAVSSGAQLLSVTNLPLNADGETTIYTVPAGVRCVLSYAILVAGADAGSTDLTIGADGSETDWLGTQQLDNLDAQYDAVMLMPVPNATPVKIKSYAAATVIKAVVANNAGGATNTLYLYGMLY